MYPRTLKSLCYAVLRIAVALYVCAGVLLFFFQEKIIFHPEVLAADYKFPAGDERLLEIGGQKIDTLLFSAPHSRGTILYFHGNAGSLRGWDSAAEELSRRTGWNVLIFDYPGFGKSSGNIRSEKQLHEIAAFLFSIISDSHIVLYGRSIGTGLAVKLAQENRIAGLILESPYLSLKSVAANEFPWAPLFLLKYSLPSEEWLPKVEAPILILHGTQDEVIPYAQGEKLSRLNPHAKLVSIDHGHHNDLSDFAPFWPAIDGFLTSLP